MGMMKVKSPGVVGGQVASATLAYPGNSFKYSPMFPADDPQKLYVFDMFTTTLQSRAANAASSACSDSPVSSLVVPTSAEKTQNEPSNVVSHSSVIRRKTSSQKCDEILSLPDEDTLGQNQEHFQTEKVTMEALKNEEMDIQETEHTSEVTNGPKKYKN